MTWACRPLCLQRGTQWPSPAILPLPVWLFMIFFFLLLLLLSFLWTSFFRLFVSASLWLRGLEKSVPDFLATILVMPAVDALPERSTGGRKFHCCNRLFIIHLFSAASFSSFSSLDVLPQPQRLCWGDGGLMQELAPLFMDLEAKKSVPEVLSKIFVMLAVNTFFWGICQISPRVK